MCPSVLCICNVHAWHDKNLSKNIIDFIKTIQMALRVWKESMIEKVKEPLVKALLQEIRRYSTFLLCDFLIELSLSLSLFFPYRARDEQTSDLTMVRDVVASLGKPRCEWLCGLVG